MRVRDFALGDRGRLAARKQRQTLAVAFQQFGQSCKLRHSGGVGRVLLHGLHCGGKLLLHLPVIRIAGRNLRRHCTRNQARQIEPTE